VEEGHKSLYFNSEIAYNYLMMIEKEFQMKKVLASLLIAGSIATPAMAQHHHGGGNPWIPFGAGVIIGNVLTQPRYYSPPPVYVYPQQPQVVYQQPQVIYQQPQVVYSAPTQAPIFKAPGQVCELKSEMINGQVVTGNFCYYP
jgi:hypothetical protein